MWVLDLINNNIYNEDITDYHTALQEPYPYICWTLIESNNLTNTGLPNYHSPALDIPYPNVCWYVNSGNELTCNGIPSYYSPALGPSYPYPCWYNNGLNNLTTTGIPLFEPLGAFAHASNLEIFKTCKSLAAIGPHSFTYSGLTYVNLPENCEYQNTTFPEGCDVTGGIVKI